MLKIRNTHDHLIWRLKLNINVLCWESKTYCLGSILDEILINIKHSVMFKSFCLIAFNLKLEAFTKQRTLIKSDNVLSELFCIPFHFNFMRKLIKQNLWRIKIQNKLFTKQNQWFIWYLNWRWIRLMNCMSSK